MKSLFEPSASAEIENRLAKLTPHSQRQWGKMDPAQMLAHCNEWMDMAAGRAAGCRTILVGPEWRRAAEYPATAQPAFAVPDLLAAARITLKDMAQPTLEPARWSDPDAATLEATR